MNSNNPKVKSITSSENGKYKGWQKLLTKKYREKERRFLVEGELLIKDALSSGAKMLELIIREDADFQYEDLCKRDAVFYSLSEKLFDKLSQTEHGRDVMAVFEMPDTPYENWASGDIVVLDRLQDPGNLGTIIRTSDAAGVSGIVLMKGTVDPFSPKALRAAAGSIFRVPLVEANDADDLRKILKSLKADPVAMDVNGAKDHYDMPEGKRLAIIVGNEGAGICDEILEMSNERIKIPMREGIESLNAAMAFGIVIYERVRRRCKKS